MSGGYVGILWVELHFPEAGSLKGKRKYVQSAKAQLQRRFGASVAEVAHHDLWQRAGLTAAFAARELGELDKLMDDAERYLGGQEWELEPGGARGGDGRVSERMRRVNESVREVVSEAIVGLKDPRIGFVTVTGVDTSPDLRVSTIYVSVLGSKKKQRKSLEGLNSSAGALQEHLATELRMKRTPQLTFEYDPTVEQGVRMSKLIDELTPDDEPQD